MYMINFFLDRSSRETRRLPGVSFVAGRFGPDPVTVLSQLHLEVPLLLLSDGVFPQLEVVPSVGINPRWP